MDCENKELVDQIKRDLKDKIYEVSKKYGYEKSFMIGDNRVDWPKLIQKICEADPSDDGEYAIWIVESYLDGGFNSLEDLGRIQTDLEEYQYLLDNKLLLKDATYHGKGYKSFCQKIDETDINMFNGLIGCEYAHNREMDKYHQSLSYQMADDGKFLKASEDAVLKCHCLGCPRPGLDDLLERHKKELLSQKKKMKMSPKAQEGTVTTVDGANCLMVRLENQDAAVFWGQGTKWCTAGKAGNMFNDYRKDGPIYVIIDKKNHKIKYQLHFASESIMDSHDKPVSLGYLIKQYPEAFNCEMTEEIPNLLERSVCVINDPGIKPEKIETFSLKKSLSTIDKNDIVLLNKFVSELDYRIRVESESKLAKDLDKIWKSSDDIKIERITSGHLHVKYIINEQYDPDRLKMLSGIIDEVVINGAKVEIKHPIPEVRTVTVKNYPFPINALMFPDVEMLNVILKDDIRWCFGIFTNVRDLKVVLDEENEKLTSTLDSENFPALRSLYGYGTIEFKGTFYNVHYMSIMKNHLPVDASMFPNLTRMNAFIDMADQWYFGTFRKLESLDVHDIFDNNRKLVLDRKNFPALPTDTRSKYTFK